MAESAGSLCFGEKSFTETAIDDDVNSQVPWLSVYITFLVANHMLQTLVALD